MVKRFFCLVLFGFGFALASPVFAQPDPDFIRVAVVRSDPEISLQIYGRFTIRALHTGNLIQQGRRLPSVSVRPLPQGLQMGESVIPFYGVRIEPDSDAAISLNGKRLRGAIEIVRQKNMKLLVVNDVDLEAYLRGVLSKEAPDYWPEESLKAIAIAARTYALYQRFLKEAGDYDVTGDVMSQDYGGKTTEKVATTHAVKATAGWIIMHGNKLFPTFYHSTCGGMTEHARVMGNFDLAPLRGGIRCGFCTASPFYSWQRRLTKADVNWALRNSPYGAIGAIQTMQVTQRTPSGRVQELVIAGARRRLKLTGFDVRSIFGFERIRSPLFNVVPVGDGFLIQGHGWGHGVGMCQWGAAELARRGLSASEILQFYYPEIQLVPIKELANKPIVIIKGET